MSVYGIVTVFIVARSLFQFPFWCPKVSNTLLAPPLMRLGCGEGLRGSQEGGLGYTKRSGCRFEDSLDAYLPQRSKGASPEDMASLEDYEASLIPPPNYEARPPSWKAACGLRVQQRQCLIFPCSDRPRRDECAPEVFESVLQPVRGLSANVSCSPSRVSRSLLHPLQDPR